MKNYVDKHTGRYISGRIKSARNYVYACTPYIDKKHLDILLLISSNRIRVRLITSNRQSGFYAEEHINSNKKPGSTIQCLVLTQKEFVHAKMYIIDDSFAMDGSSNLTDSGLWRQVNYVHLYDDIDEIKMIKSDFDRIWTYNIENYPHKLI